MAWYTWVDTPVAGSNVQAATDFAADSQREDGFTAGTTASAIRVNSALRQANLVAVALMDAIGDTNNLTSTVDTIKNSIKSKLLIAGSNFTTSANITANKFIGSADITNVSAANNVVKFKIGDGTVYEKTINNVANANNATYATSAGSATSATYSATANSVGINNTYHAITYNSATRTLSFNTIT